MWPTTLMWAPVATWGTGLVRFFRTLPSQASRSTADRIDPFPGGHREQPGELRLQHQAALVGHAQVLVAGAVADLGDQRLAAGDPGQDAPAGPARVDLGEQVADLRPGGALAGPAGLADQHDIQAGRVRGGVGDGVGAGPDDVAGGGQEGEQQRRPGRPRCAAPGS